MIGAELAAKREKCGLTQGQLAKFIGIGRTSIWRIERGEEPVSRAIEVSSQMLEVSNASLEKWVNTLHPKQQHSIRRRQNRNILMETTNDRDI